MRLVNRSGKSAQAIVLIGLPSQRPHNNGYSLARTLMAMSPATAPPRAWNDIEKAP